MLSNRQGKTGIITCFHLFLTVCLLSRFSCCARSNHAIMFLKNFLNEKVVEFALFYLFAHFWNLTKLHKDTMLLWIYLCEAPIYSEKRAYFYNFLQNKDLIARTNIPVQHLTSCKDLSLNPCRNWNSQFCVCFAKKKRLNRDTKLTAILRRQFCIILMALEQNIFSVLGSVASQLHPIQLAVNKMQNYRLKIAISLGHPHYFSV